MIFFQNWLLLTIGSIEPTTYSLSLSMRSSDIVMGLHLLHIFLDTIKGKCLVVTIGILLVCHCIATTKSRKLDHIDCFYICFNSRSHTIVNYVFLSCNPKVRNLLFSIPHTNSIQSPSTSQWYLGKASIKRDDSAVWESWRKRCSIADFSFLKLEHLSFKVRNEYL